MIPGYISIHRKIIKWEWYTDPNTFRLFIHILLQANWEPRKWQGITIKRSQFITSYETLAKELRLSVQQVRTSLSKLIVTGEVTRTSTNKFTLLTVVKYDSYQYDINNSNNQNNKLPNKPITNEQQTDNKQVTTTNKNNNINNLNKENKTNKVINSIDATFQGNGGVQNHAEILYVVDQFYQHRIATNPIAFKTFDKEKSYSQSILELDKLIRIDKYTLDEIKSVLNFAVNDSFWQDQVYSLARLRRKSGNGETKFKNIYLKFKASTKQQDAMDAWAAEMEEK